MGYGGKISSQRPTDKTVPPTWKFFVCMSLIYSDVIENNRIEENQPLCYGWYWSCIKTTHYLACLLVSDVFCLSLIRNTKRLTKGRLACVYSGIKDSCWAARLLHVESQPHVSQYEDELWYFNPPVATPPPSTLWDDAVVASIPPPLLLQCGDSLSGHQQSLTALAHSLSNWLQITWNNRKTS